MKGNILISERQIEALLCECEAELARDLSGLRARLLHNRHYNGTIWELIVLYTAIKRTDLQIDYEPDDAMPDIRFYNASGTRFWFEVSEVSSASNEQKNRINELRRWICEQLTKTGYQLKGAAIDIRPKSSEFELSIPPIQSWKSEKKSYAWKSFISDISRNGSGTWDFANGNAHINLKTNQLGFFTGGHPVPNLPKSAKQHPVYKLLKRKGEQIKKWESSITDKPIVVVICSTDISSEFDIKGNGVGLEQAIYSALLDPSLLSSVHRYNILHDGSFYGSGIKSKRVMGARLISAVLFVRLENQLEGLSYKSNMIAAPILFDNPHAETPLSELDKKVVRGLNFNLVEYGPGREAWQRSHKGSAKDRNRKIGGKYTMGSNGNGSVYIELPTIILLRILAGDITAEDALSEFGDNSKLIDLFKRALDYNQEIEKVSIIDSDPIKREEPCIRIEFGIPKPAVIARVKDN